MSSLCSNLDSYAANLVTGACLFASTELVFILFYARTTVQVLF